MKRIILIIGLVSVFHMAAQESYMVKNELKFNPIYLFGTNSGFPEVSYERSVTTKSTLGLSLGFRLGSEDKFNYVDDFVSYNFSALPYYRYHFGKASKNGFFIEGNTMALSRESLSSDSDEWRFGAGVGIGAKFVIKNSWVIDFVLGGGYVFEERNNNNRVAEVKAIAPSLNFPHVYPRLGITIGKRF